MLDGEVDLGSRVQLPLSMVNRHGLVAGATGTGKTKTLQILAGQLSDAGVPVFIADVKGDLTGISQPGDAAAGPVAERCAQLGLDVRTQGPSRRAAVAERRPRGAGSRHDPLVRAAAAGQGARSQQDADLGALAGLQVLRRRELPVARSGRPADDLEVPVLGRRQAGARGVRRRLEGERGRAAALARRAGRSRSRRLLRRARVRRRGSAARHARGQGRGEPARDQRRDGPPAPVQHLHVVDAGSGLRRAPGGGRPARSPSWRSSSTRPTCCSTMPRRRCSTRSS